MRVPTLLLDVTQAIADGIVPFQLFVVEPEFRIPVLGQGANRRVSGKDAHDEVNREIVKRIGVNRLRIRLEIRRGNDLNGECTGSFGIAADEIRCFLFVLGDQAGGSPGLATPLYATEWDVITVAVHNDAS